MRIHELQVRRHPASLEAGAGVLDLLAQQEAQVDRLWLKPTSVTTVPPVPRCLRLRRELLGDLLLSSGHVGKCPTTGASLDLPSPPDLEFLTGSVPRASQIFEYNGSAVVAMVGKNCFAIASDRRLGVQLQTVATDFQRVFKIHDKLYIGLSGLATDAQTLYQRLVFRHKLYQLREERDMKPETFASLVSALLYEKRELAKDFVVSGTASESLYGACESIFKPNMKIHKSLDNMLLFSMTKEPEELVETISQALLSSVDRDCLSGWGGYVLLLTPTEVQERVLKARMD
ncbi:hypothetical protein PR202_ga14845 [Eleusine coracana subsp. coracana]|uniref:Proteasome subunit beta n=1 Tax=Eleusine coracana subsp. coracana TaxID=191504 RepID=A0AAV5CIL0_ELECO|nr:hypothetical protein PR202_ga14845 [Eleusine coracana subsp. coracana]